MAMDTRVAAAKVISGVLGGQSLNLALPPLLDKVSPRDRGLLQQLCYGTLRDHPRLAGILRQLLIKPLKDKDRDIQSLLLVGLYQLNDTRIPDHAAVASTVEATRGLKKPWAKGLCNALLRRFLRERSDLENNLQPAEAAAHPAWLYREINEQWPSQADQLIRCNNSQPPLVLRVNARRGSRADYLTMLAEQGITATPGKLCEQAIYLDQARDVAELPGFSDGWVSVQDEAAQLAAGLLAAAAGDRVLDACAAPGGKTCHILELQPELAEIVAMDVDTSRLQRVTENLNRLKLSAKLMTADASLPIAELKPEQFDHILVDAPCSASGVVRRHPDIKLLRREADIGALHVQQITILNGVWPLLAKGGRLLYATCSILTQENSEVVGEFLQAHENASIKPLAADWGETQPWGRQLLPDENGSDGLFYALIEKAL
ncbi:MAG: 16S rRNA (cytosine967-C5)-methyltransferase [Halieaceae bacterium]|jgi:16S rRNA (cytosine967-C5)-methyltransferase